MPSSSDSKCSNLSKASPISMGESTSRYLNSTPCLLSSRHFATTGASISCEIMRPTTFGDNFSTATSNVNDVFKLVHLAGEHVGLIGLAVDKRDPHGRL